MIGERTSYIYRLRIMGPVDIDADTVAAIEQTAAAFDNLEQAIWRWLGNAIDEAEEAINEALPDGWYCKIEEPAR